MSFERDNIRRMHGYAPGEQPDDADTIKLNTNENPYPPSPAIDDLLNSLRGSDLRRYPPPTAGRFRELAADRHGVPADHVIATRGGDELLRLAITTFVEPGATIAMTQPTYSLYPVLAQVQDCRILEVPLADDWSVSPDFVERACEVQAPLTLVVNPHAPSGHLLDVQSLASIASAVPGVLLVDEAYVDFIDPALNYDSLALVREFENVLILRTLSKGYSLAGLRFGYGIGQPGLVRPMLEKTRDSYNLDTISQRIAEIALADIEHASKSWEKVRAERARLGARLTDLGFDVAPSQANFLLVTVPGAGPGAEDIYEQLKSRGVLVRYFSQPRLTDKLRITVGTGAENDRLLELLGDILGR